MSNASALSGLKLPDDEEPNEMTEFAAKILKGEIRR